MKILHLNAGNETGGGMHHILLLLSQFSRAEVILGVFENGELAERARKIGVETKVFQQNTRKDFSVINQVVHYCNTQKIDILHTHGPRANLFGVFITKKIAAKWIVTVHSNPEDDFLDKGIKGRIFTWLNKWSIKKADHLLAISERFNNMLVKYGISAQKITTILNGIEFSEKSMHAYARKEFNLSERDFVIGMVARLEKVKDHLTAIRAFQKVVQRKPHSKLLLVGEGTEMDELKKEVKELSLTGNVQFFGYRTDVSEMIGLFDVFLLTSKSESFPLVLLEAARGNIPAITTNVGGVDQMIPSNEYGWITEVGDEIGISGALLEAEQLKELGTLKNVGQLFGEHCESRFSIANQAEVIYDVYKKIVAN